MNLAPFATALDRLAAHAAGQPQPGPFIVVARSVDFPTERATLAEALALQRTLARAHPGQGFRIMQVVA